MAREQDHYTKRALREGYPARSVYKLEEIQHRFSVIRKGAKVLDIGAAPGSFSIYALKAAGPAGSLVAVDLKNEMPDLPNNRFTFIQGDAFSESNIEKILSLGPYDCVLSDAAPSTTGNRTVDTARSAGLAEQAIALARNALVPDGNIVVKVFQGGDEKELLESLRSAFRSAKAVKPKASRKGSFEVFLVATGYKHSIRSIN